MRKMVTAAVVLLVLIGLDNRKRFEGIRDLAAQTFTSLADLKVNADNWLSDLNPIALFRPLPIPRCDDPRVILKSKRAITNAMNRILGFGSDMGDSFDGLLHKLSTDSSSLNETITREVQQIYRRNTGYVLDQKYIQVCSVPQDNTIGLRVIVVQNSYRTAEFGVAVLNFGVPGGVAEYDLEFMEN